MNEFEKPLRLVETRLAEQKGPFVFFALFLREDSPDRWDLVVAAPWMDDDWVGGIKAVSQQVSQIFQVGLAVRLSRISPVNTQDPAVQAFVRHYPAQHGWLEIRNEVFLGLRIVEGFIVTAQVLPQLQTQAA